MFFWLSCGVRSRAPRPAPLLRPSRPAPLRTARLAFLTLAAAVTLWTGPYATPAPPVTTGAITGHVTQAGTASPVAGARVIAMDTAGASLAETTTDAAGAYTLAGIAPGTYFVRTDGAGRYVDEIYNDVPCPLAVCQATEGAPVIVTDGATTAGIDFTLTLGGRIGGAIRAAGTGAAITSARVEPFAPDGRPLGGTTLGPRDAYLTMGLPAGEYFVATRNADHFINQVYPDTPCAGCDPAVGQLVTVTAGADTLGIDFTLQRGGAIAGSIFIHNGGNPLPLRPSNALVYNEAARAVTIGATQPDGTYLTEDGLPPGNYYVATHNFSGFIDEVYNDLPCVSCDPRIGTPVTVTGTDTTSGIGFMLRDGGTITGTVRDATTLEPLAGQFVDVYSHGGRMLWSFQTTATGSWMSGGLEPGLYHVRTRNTRGYVNKAWNNTTCLECDVTQTTPILIVGGTWIDGIDFDLQPGAVVTGRMTTAGDVPVWDAYVHVLRGDDTRVARATTDCEGRYRTPGGLPPGTYYLQTDNDAGLLEEAWNNVACPFGCPAPTGAPVVVSAPSIMTGYDFDLDRGTRLLGRVTDTGGLGIPGIQVNVHNAAGEWLSGSDLTTDEGTYATRALPPGTYYLRTWNTGGWVDELYDDLPTWTAWALATPVVAPVATDVTGVDFDLGLGGQIAGRFTDESTGLGIGPPVWLEIHDAAGHVLGVGIAVQADGTYLTTGGVPPGTYYLRTGNDQGYANEVYDNLPASTPILNGTPIPVTAGATTDGVDFALGETPLTDLHPADGDADFRLTDKEATDYALAWISNTTWPQVPVPIPMAFATRAGYLCLAGGPYRRDAGECPLCWVSTVTGEVGRGPAADTAEVHGGTAARELPATFVPGVAVPVRISVAPYAGTLTQAVQDQPPAGWKVTQISHDGVFDEDTGTVRWIAPDGIARVLSYKATAPAGASGLHAFTGLASFNGANAPVGGGGRIGVRTNLKVTGLVVPARGAAGTSIEVLDATRCLGPGPTLPTTTALYLSVDPSWGGDDVELGARTVPALLKGKTSAEITSAAIPPDTAPGRYYLIAWADARGVLDETHEYDNTTAKPIVVGPDLRQLLLAAPLAAVRGATIPVRDTLKNEGGASTPVSRTAFYLSVDAILDAGDALLGGRDVGALAPGGVDFAETGVLVPPDAVPGRYFLLAVADAGGAVAEVDETNNVRTRKLTVR